MSEDIQINLNPLNTNGEEVIAEGVINTHESRPKGTLELIRTGAAPGGVGVSIASFPDPDFDVDVTEGAAPLTVQFTDTSEGEPFGWFWEFGDTTTSEEQNPQHVYDYEATFHVQLTVKNHAGELGKRSILKSNLITVGEGGGTVDGDFLVITTLGNMYRWTSSGGWSLLMDVSAIPGGGKISTLVVFNGALYAGTYSNGRLLRYDSGVWTSVAEPYPSTTSIYDFAELNGELYAGVGPTYGRLMHWTGSAWKIDCYQYSGSRWWRRAVPNSGVIYGTGFIRKPLFRTAGLWSEEVGPIGDEDMALVMFEYNGALYVATTYEGHVYKYNGSGSPILLDTVDVGNGAQWSASSEFMFNGKWHIGTRSGSVVKLMADDTLVEVIEPFSYAWIWGAGVKSMAVRDGELWEAIENHAGDISRIVKQDGTLWVEQSTNPPDGGRVSRLYNWDDWAAYL